MIIGAVIVGGVIGGVFSSGPYTTSTDVLIGSLIGAFFGLGIGTFPRTVKRDFESGDFWIGDIRWHIKKSIEEQQAKQATNLEGCFYGLFHGLLMWLVGIFFQLSRAFIKLGWAFIKSPFVAIYELVKDE